MKADQFLSKAATTMKDRGKDYDKSKEGKEERSVAKTVDAFNTITGNTISTSEGWLFLLLLKQVRQWSKEGYHKDSALDSVAYAALLAEALSEETVSKAPKKKVKKEKNFEESMQDLPLLKENLKEIDKVKISLEKKEDELRNLPYVESTKDQLFDGGMAVAIPNRDSKKVLTDLSTWGDNGE